eukprot:scaffold6233_cov129-Amphora_coffeaeformis.AAC.2
MSRSSSSRQGILRGGWNGQNKSGMKSPLPPPTTRHQSGSLLYLPNKVPAMCGECWRSVPAFLVRSSGQQSGPVERFTQNPENTSLVHSCKYSRS